MYSLEGRVLQLEEGPVLVYGRPRGRRVREAAGDEPVGAAAERVQRGQGGVQPGLGHAQAGVDQRAGHGKVYRGEKKKKKKKKRKDGVMRSGISPPI